MAKRDKEKDGAQAPSAEQSRLPARTTEYPRPAPWWPEHSFGRLRDEIDALFDRFFGGWPAPRERGWAPERYWGVDVEDTDNEVVVRTEVRGKGEPVQLDYRLEKAEGGWKIYDVNVLGIWLVDNYRSSFAQEVSSGGIDGLISKLAERNKAAGANAGGKS